MTTPELFFAEHPKAAVAFSGGVDSAFLLYLAKSYGADVTAYFVDTEFQPAFELEDARATAEYLGVKLVVIPMSALSDEVKCNPADRCYHCKKRIFGAILRRAAEDGYTEVFDGTNASDDSSGRPGMRALGEMNVLSPLRLLDITKKTVREEAKAAGIAVWDKPSYACLATRIPAGTEITPELLDKVEASENSLKNIGFYDFRVRVLSENTAKLEIREEQFGKMAREHDQVRIALKEHFPNVVMDLAARKAREN